VSRTRLVVILSLLGLFVAVALIRFHGSSDAPRAQTPQSGDSARRGGGVVVPITTAPAKAEDFAIRRRTIGIMESPASVVVKSRIESQVLEQHVKDGQLVKKGDLLFTLDDREIKATIARDEAQLAKDKAALARTEADLRRTEELITRNVAPRQQFDQITADNKAAAATVDADQAQLQADHLRLDYTKITAPIDGRVGAIRVTPGNLISVNDPTGLVTITQIQPIRVGFTLAERDLAALRKAAAAPQRPAVRVYTPGGSEPLGSGTLDFVDSAIDVASGTIAAKATFANENLELWPGLFVDVEIDLDIRPRTVMIPGVAIQSSQQGPFVFVARPDQTAQMRKVQLVGIEGDRAAIASGVEDGERVIVEGQMRLTDGARVNEATAANERGSADDRNRQPRAGAGETPQ
jgi:membrane fusion protein, multidrug efflux system